MIIITQEWNECIHKKSWTKGVAKAAADVNAKKDEEFKNKSSKTASLFFLPLPPPGPAAGLRVQARDSDAILLYCRIKCRMERMYTQKEVDDAIAANIAKKEEEFKNMTFLQGIN